jgi:hypothetical protein
MITLGGFVVGAVFAASGVGVILNAYYLNSQMLFLGAWERKFGAGTGTNGYQFFGFLMLIIGLFSMMGILDLTANPVGKSTTTQSSPTINISPFNNRLDQIAP